MRSDIELIPSQADALNIANGQAVLTGRRQWVWRGQSGNWWITPLDQRVPEPVAEACS